MIVIISDKHCTDLDDCLKLLLACFRNWMSALCPTSSGTAISFRVGSERTAKGREGRGAEEGDACQIWPHRGADLGCEKCLLGRQKKSVVAVVANFSICI